MNIPVQSHAQRMSKCKCQVGFFFPGTQTSVYMWGFFFTVRCLGVSGPGICSAAGSVPDQTKASAIKRRASTNGPLGGDPEAAAIGSLAGSVGNVVRAGAARQRGYSSAAVSAESRRCMTHPINGSPAAFRRRRSCYTSSLQREPISLLSLSLQHSPDPAQTICQGRSRTISRLWLGTGEQSGTTSAAALHSGNNIWSENKKGKEEFWCRERLRAGFTPRADADSHPGY